MMLSLHFHHPFSLHNLWLYFCADWDGLDGRNNLRDVPWEDVFQLCVSAVAIKFCESVQVGIDVVILHCKYQVQPCSPPWFWIACASAISHRNHFFVCINRINLLHLNKSSDKVVAKGSLKLLHLLMLLPQKSLINCKLLKMFSSNVNLLYLFNGLEVLPSVKQNCLLKIFLKTLILMIQVCLCLLYPLINLKLLNFSLTPNSVKKVKANLDLSKASGPGSFPVVVLKNCESELSYILAKVFNMCMIESSFLDC